MKRVLELIQSCAPLDLPVLIRGESGTGKELVAQSLHALRHPQRKLLSLNCGAISEKLAESELFGHRKGAFTGADRQRKGAFELAANGTLFLDEVGELPMSLQAKLLRVLENGQFLALGAEHEQRSRARLLAATHRPLEEWVQSQRFREDLLYRLNILTIRLPPLRERRGCLPHLLQHFAQLAQKTLKTKVALQDSALRWAQSQPWPGNLRQLRNTVLRAAIGSTGLLGAKQMERALSEDRAHPVAANHLSLARGSFESMKLEILQDALQQHGSLRRAALALSLPKSTLADWLQKAPSCGLELVS